MTRLLNASGAYDDTTIGLSTRAGNPIDNIQVWQHSLFDWRELSGYLTRFNQAQQVSEACPVYNCHGLTFGSRRTQVTHSVFPILDDDGFDLVPEKDVRTGDIVVYCSARGEIVHSGFVVWKREVTITGDAKPTVIPMIWSKWGKGCEMLHRIAECPYLDDEGNFTQFYRLKRWNPEPAAPVSLSPLVRLA